MGTDKLWVDVCGRPLIAWTLDAVRSSAVADITVVVAPQDAWQRIRDLHGADAGGLHLVEGGDRRQDSVRAGVELCAALDVDLLCVHDAARPLCPPELFVTTLGCAEVDGAATAAVPVVDSIKRVGDDNLVSATIDRTGLFAVQTPQAFRTGVLAAAHHAAVADRVAADDDCSLVEAMGRPVRMVAGDRDNFKVTTAQDLALVRCIVGARP